MNRVFNTRFEVSLRVLLLLEAAPRSWRSAEWLAAADFITVYAREFGTADNNLHGNNSFKYSEFALRREIVTRALKSLALDGLADMHPTDSGFVFVLSKNGGDYISGFESGYAEKYRRFAELTVGFAKNRSGQDFFDVDPREEKKIRVAKKAAIADYNNSHLKNFANRKIEFGDYVPAGAIDLHSEAKSIIDEISRTESRISEAIKHNRLLLAKIMEFNSRLTECDALYYRYQAYKTQMSLRY